MFRSYLKTSLRNLLRHKSYTIINVLGLTVGLATSIFILLWIIDEASYDRFHANGDRIFKVLINNTYPDGRIDTYAATPSKLKEVIVREIPEVEEAAQYSMETELLVKHERKAYNESGIFGDATLFTIFSFPIVRGNATMPLTDIKSIAISEDLAYKLFRDTDPIGKTVNLGASHELIVTSVFADISEHSTLRFDFVASFELFTKENPWTQHWGSGGTRTTVLLKSPDFAGVANEKIAGVIKNNCPDCTTSAFLFPYAKSRLYNEFENGAEAGGRIDQIYLFATVAILILVMACINFTNLSTARTTTRSREVGIRKSVGAQKNSLIIQFISEAMMLSFIALTFAIVIVQLLLPFFNDVTLKAIRLDVTNPAFIAGALSIAIVCGLLAGSYPAFVLARFNPVKVLKGDTKLGLTGIALRKSLVIVQFTASIILVVGSIAAYRQIVFISNRNLGFDKENIIVVDQNEGIVKAYAAIKNDLHQLSSVENIAFGGNNVFTVPITTTDPVWDNKPDNSSIAFKIYRCDAEFIPTLNIRMQQGRNFIGAQDASNYIINRKAAEVMGLSSENAVGSDLEMWNGKGKIIGITEDFHNNNLKFGIEPMIFMYSENVGSHYFIRLAGGSTSESVKDVERVFRKHNPDYPFEFTFLDEVFNQQYQTEAVIGKLSLSFTVIAVLISCLGLFGLASFNAERRIKELGIRKVMGASAADLVMMLCGDFTNLVLVSLLIGFPVSWYLISEYLSAYAFHAKVGWGVYIFTSVVMLVIVVLSVGFQSAKAAISNPIDSLRNE